MNNENVKQLATGCLYVLLDRALIDFPGTTSAHPSSIVWVKVDQKGFLIDTHRKYFPIRVPGSFWQEVVIPVLKDPYNQIHTRTTSTLWNADKQGWLESGVYDRIISQLEAALTERMQLKGYLPVPEVEVSPELPIPGEPIEEPSVGDLSFPNPDGTLIWPEGHIRLVYPVV